MTVRKLTIPENRRRIKELAKFLVLVKQYEKSIRCSEPYGKLVLGEDGERIREKINQRISINQTYLQDAGQAYPLDRLFERGRPVGLSTGPVDVIERAIGFFESDKNWAWIRTVNPFYLIGRILEFFPFAAAEKLGFDRREMEAKLWGKITKVLAQVLGYLLPFIGATLLGFFDWD